LCVHVPVLLKEAVEWLGCFPGGTFVDCTVGSGGHAQAVLERIGSSGKLIAIDADADALRQARKRFSGRTVTPPSGRLCRGRPAPAAGAVSPAGKPAGRWRYVFVRDNFRNLREILDSLGIQHVDGILFDLGLSSDQLEDASKGFSLYRSGPLDMRLDRRQRLTAAEIVNRYPQDEIAKIIREFGEERSAGRIAAAILRKRKKSEISSTTELAELVMRVVGRRRGRIHPATKTFQSLRIAVNDELESLRCAMPQAIMALKPGGRLVVTAYHSLEDRIVKQTFREFERGCICPPSFPVCKCGRVSEVEVLTRKPIRPSQREIEENPRSRSGRMRVCERKRRNAGT